MKPFDAQKKTSSTLEIDAGVNRKMCRKSMGFLPTNGSKTGKQNPSKPVQ